MHGKNCRDIAVVRSMEAAMAGGKKADGSSNDQLTEKSPDKMPEPVEQTTAEATLTILQTLKMQFDSLSTRLEKHEEIN
eukprot:jgi/Tetstr1/425283/TSEL_015735.t1